VSPHGRGGLATHKKPGGVARASRKKVFSGRKALGTPKGGPSRRKTLAQTLLKAGLSILG